MLLASKFKQRVPVCLVALFSCFLFGILDHSTHAAEAKSKSQSQNRERSLVMPVLVEAIKKVLSEAPTSVKDVKSFTSEAEMEVVEILIKERISPTYLSKILGRIEAKKRTGDFDPYLLPPKDKADELIQQYAQNAQTNSAAPMPSMLSSMMSPMGFHAYKVDVMEEDDDFFGDDIYCYFFITDGVIPTGKVTSVYKGLTRGSSFFLNELDRVLFPVAGVQSAIPTNHLIIDYGIVESDGDDIREMQKITGIIIDIALAVYSASNPSTAAMVQNLRQEVKNLANVLLELNLDDRLVTDSIYFDQNDLMGFFRERSFVEFRREHKGKHGHSRWHYNIHFRALKD